MSKEPGQLAYEKSRPSWLWCEISVSERKTWAAVEAAIRADEAAKVRAATIEECAKVCEEGVDMQHPIITSHTMTAFHKSPALAAAIRAKIGAEHG